MYQIDLFMSWIYSIELNLFNEIIRRDMKFRKLFERMVLKISSQFL